MANSSQNGWSSELVQFLGVAVLVFFLVVIVVAAILLWRAKCSAIDVNRVIGVLSIVSVASFLLVVGYTSEQLTPVIGLFGAIVGYLLGKDSKDTDKKND